MKITGKFWMVIWITWIVFAIRVTIFSALKAAEVEELQEDEFAEDLGETYTSQKSVDPNRKATRYKIPITKSSKAQFKLSLKKGKGKGKKGKNIKTTKFPSWMFRRYHEGMYNCENDMLETRLPDVILIGNRKAGTHALIRFLRTLNPQIRELPGGETHFFDRNSTYRAGVEYYKTLMPKVCPTDVVMEKTPDYFTHSYVPERIFKWNKKVKLLVSLRDPIQRAISDFQEFKRLMLESKVHPSDTDARYLKKEFEEVVLNEEGQVDENMFSIKSSLDDVSMKRWLQYFPLEQIHVIDADSFTYDNPAIELSKIEHFIGVKPKITEWDFYYSATRGYYCITKRACLDKGHIYDKLNTTVYKKLLYFFRPHVAELKDLINKELSWMETYLG